MNKNAGYVLETIRDRIDIIKGYDIDTTSIESDFKILENKFNSKVLNSNSNSQVAYTDTEIMSIEKSIDSFSTYLDNIIKGITVFENIDSAYKFMVDYCSSKNMKSNTAFKKHVERVASGMLDYSDFYVLGIRKNNINKYLEKLYELIKEEYREFGSTAILTAIEGSKMDSSFLTELMQKQLLELLRGGSDKYKKEYLSANILENGKINRELLAIISLVENNYDEKLIYKLIDLTNKIDDYKAKQESDKRDSILDFLHFDSSRSEILKKVLTGLLSISVLATTNALFIKNRKDWFSGTYRKDFYIEDNEWKYLGGAVEEEISADRDGLGYLVEYSETRPDGTKSVKEYKLNSPIDSVKRGEPIQLSEDMLEKEEIISVEGTEFSDNGFSIYKEYSQIPMEGSDYVILGVVLALINVMLVLLDKLIHEAIFWDYDTFFPILEDIYNGILAIKEAIDKLKEHEAESLEISNNIKLLEERYKELTERFSEAKKIYSDAKTISMAVNKGASIPMSLQLAKRFNKEQLIVFYYYLDAEKKEKVDRLNENLLDNQRKILREFKSKDEEEQKLLAEAYSRKLENKKAESKEEKVKIEVIEKKKEEKNVKNNKRAQAETIIKAIENLSESIKVYSEYEDKEILDKLYHTIQIDEDTLFEKVNDHYEFRKEFLPVLKFLNLSFIDTTDLKVSDIDFRGTNIRINPQVVYNKDLSYSKFDDENLFGDFSNCNLSGADISKESLPVGIYKSIIDNNTKLPNQKEAVLDLD